MEPRIAVAPDIYSPGLKSLEDKVDPAYRPVTLQEACSSEYQSDAHFVTYVVTGALRQPRINKELIRQLDDKNKSLIAFHYLVADVDNPGHCEWTGELRAKAREQEATTPALQTCGVYETAHGRRIIQQLANPINVEHIEDYLTDWLNLLESQGVAVDWACVDWTRHFRLPHVVRDGRPYHSAYVNLEKLQPITTPEPPARPVPVVTSAAPSDAPLSDRQQWARAYLAACPPAIQGNHGDAKTWEICNAIGRGFDLCEGDALAAMADWNARCEPPWSDEELTKRIRRARGRAIGEPIGGRLERTAPKEAVEPGFVDVQPKNLAKRNAIRPEVVEPEEHKPEEHKQTKFAKLSDAIILSEVVPTVNAGHVLLRRDDGSEQIFTVNGRNEVKAQVKSSSVEQCIYDHLFQSIGPAPGSLIDRAFWVWRMSGRKVDQEPIAFLFADAPMEQLCLRRLDWSPARGDFSAWQEFLSRLSDPDAFCGWIWSVFEPENDSRQYIWMYGDGVDGKSKAMEAIMDIMGNAATSISNSALKEPRFINATIFGKRLITYADCKNSKFGMTELVRNWTSGDAVPIEQKGLPAFSAKLKCKLWVSSNHKPEFTGQKADMSRVIYLTVSERSGDADPSWPKRLREQSAAFLHHCREVYKRVCPNGADIATNGTSKILRVEAKEDFEERFAAIFEESFEENPVGCIPAGDFYRAMQRSGLTGAEIGDFKAWLTRSHGVKVMRTNSARWYEGINLRGEYRS